MKTIITSNCGDCLFGYYANGDRCKLTANIKTGEPGKSVHKALYANTVEDFCPLRKGGTYIRLNKKIKALS